MSMPGGDGLSLDQAPPLVIPVSFFVTAPLAVVAAGLVMVLKSAVLVTPLSPATVALTHLMTLGAVAMVMFGAMYQMLPVVAGARVPAARLAHGVHAALTIGLVLSVWGLLGPSPSLVLVGGVLLGLAVLVFVGATGWALVRAPTVDATVWGMRLAVLSLIGLGALGLVMGQGHAGGMFLGARTVAMQVHLTLALLGWVGALLTAVSWKVLPMFYLTAVEPSSRTTASLILLVSGLAGSLIAGAMGIGSTGVALAALPAALSVWVIHPLLTLRALKLRKRRRADGSLRFWKAGMGWALLCIPAAIGALFLPYPRAPLLLGWIAIWGWAGMVLHGMLCRIVPFLVWFHRLSPLIGIVPVPPMRRMLPDVLVQRSFAIHLTSVLLGVAAILTGSDVLARICGVGLIATGVSLGVLLVTVLRVRAPDPV